MHTCDIVRFTPFNEINVHALSRLIAGHTHPFCVTVTSIAASMTINSNAQVRAQAWRGGGSFYPWGVHSCLVTNGPGVQISLGLWTPGSKYPGGPTILRHRRGAAQSAAPSLAQPDSYTSGVW